MQLGIFAKTFAGQEPRSVLAAAAEAGYACVQYNMACSGLASMPDSIPAGTAEALADASSDVGVGIAALSGTYNMIHPDVVKRLEGHRRLEVLAASCKSMGTRLITLCTGTRDPHDQWRHHPDNTGAAAWRDLLDSMSIALEIAEPHGIDLGIEPELANVVNSAAKARQLIDEMQNPRLKIVLDAANLFEVDDLSTQRRIVSEAVDLLADRTIMVHAKDRAADGRFATTGQGVLDYQHYLTCLHGAGFDGPLITHGLSADEAPATAAFLRGAMRRAGLDPR